MTSLRLAIEDLYRAFARYPKPTAIEVCPCGCSRENVVCGLLDKPLNGLSLQDLMLYSADAMTTVGTETDFKYFLPRILDRITVEEYRYNPEFVFGKLRYAKLNSSPNGEQVAVTEYLHSFWCRSLGEYPLTLPAFASISDVVSSIGSAGVDLSWYLEQWTRADSSASTWNLADLVCEEAHNLKRAGVLILHSGISCPSRLTSFPDGWCDRKCYVDCKALTCKTSQV